MPKPGSHAYDTKRARLRKQYEDEGVAADQHADQQANQTLQQDEGREPELRSERGLGPKGERER
jgi:hypothetical protein